MANPLTSNIRKILADQGLDFQGTEDDLTLALGSLGRKDLGQEFEADYRAIREANAPGTLEGLGNTAKNAFDRSRQALSTVGGIGDTAAENIAAAEQRIQNRPPSLPWEDWSKSEGMDALKVFIRDPIEITSNIITSGFTGSLPALGGGLAGGAAGAALGGPAAPVTGALGAATGTGAGSLAVEYGNKYLEVLREAGADLSDPDSIKRVVADPSVQEKAREMGLRRGIPVAAFDAISAGLAGKFLKGVRSATTAQNVRRGLTEAAIQGTLGGAGEVAGALSAGEQVSPRAVFEEVVGEIGPGAVEVGGAAMRRQMASRALEPDTPAVAPVQPVVPPSVAPAPVVQETPTPTPAAPIPPSRRVALMSEEQQRGRLSELSSATELSADQQQELELLRALLPDAQITAPVVPPEPTPRSAELTETPAVPTEPISTAAGEATGLQPSVETGVALAEPAAPSISPADFSAPASVGVPAAPEVSQPTIAPAPAVTPLQPTVEAPIATLPSVPMEAPLPSGEPAPAAPELTDVNPAPQPSPSLEDRLRAELKKPEPLVFGTINEGVPMTVDVREDPQFDALTPEAVANFRIPGAMDQSGNRSITRTAVVLEAPDGRHVMTGLLPEQNMAKVGGAGEKSFGPAVQSMAAERRAGGYQKIVKEGGNKPALLADLIGAGYKVRAFVQFDSQPGQIFQRWANRDAFDASYAATPRTTGSSAAAKVAPTASASEGIARSNVIRQREELQGKIDALGSELASADPARAAEINDEIQQLYSQLSALPEPRLAISDQPTLPAQADRAAQFAAATARIRQAGARVDVFAKTFLQAELQQEIRSRVDALIERYQRAPEAEQPAIQKAIERGQAALQAIDRVRGVAYSPDHIALGLDDIQNATLADLVTLLHEAGHAILKGDAIMQARVLRAVNKAQADLTAENAARSQRTGFNTRINGDPEELLVQTLGQRLAEEGIPDSPSFARALVQWVKDLYYRLAMAVQSAFGREPSPQLALDWFENQLRRWVGGDFDYRFSSLLDRLTPEDATQQLVRVGGERTGTPGGVANFYDSALGGLRQPEVLPETREGVAWNLRFATEEAGAANPGEELDIPYREAKARIQAAALNEIAELADQVYGAASAGRSKENAISYDEWWSIVGRGDTPKVRLAEIANAMPGAETARIGDDRMTDAMSQQARVEAKRLLKSWIGGAAAKEAKSTERATTAEAELLKQARKLNKLEANLRNADAHESTLRDELKAMIVSMAKGLKRGMNAAFSAGELAQAVREVENLSERDAIPEEYQRVFKAVLADEIPLFDYAQAIAKLEMPLGEMTRAEIVEGIEANAASDPALARLIEPRNKPLLVAMVALAKTNAQQMDLIAMRAIREPEKYLKLKGEMDAIRNASLQELRSMEQKINSARKAATLADRIKRDAVLERGRLRRMQSAIQEAEQNREIIADTKASLLEKIDQMETDAMPAPSEWMPYNGARYLAMQQDENGAWKAVERVLEWTPEGPAKNAAQLLSDVASNRQYLNAEKARQGSKTYELVKRQTQELSYIDALQRVPEIKRWWFEKFLLPTPKLLVSGGGAGAARAVQMLQRFQFLTGSKFTADIANPAAYWNTQLRKATREAGMKDERAFLDQVYEPVVYLLESEPGWEEGPALREAVRAAKRRLTTQPTENFDEAFKEFMRQTKAMSERFVKIAEENGIFVEDDRLGELRRAVSRGWLTAMRSMDAATVSTILREMENAGWKMVFKDEKTGAKSAKSFDEGVTASQRVVEAASFESLLPENATNEEDAKARTDVLENPELFSKAISGFFTPNIVRDWLVPFINKPGESVFEHAGRAIDPIDVQRAWEQSGGNVAAWIDRLGERVGLSRDVELGEEMELGDVSLEAAWRAEMLKRLDSLFLMESRIAADANQTKSLFDATGRPPHIIMDARENEMLPPEHVKHAVFDPISAKNLMATLAFHAAFGRNGEAMNRALAEIEGGLRARKAAFDRITSAVNGKEDRQRLAKAAGYDFNELKNAASTARTVEQGIGALRAQFGFNSSATGLADIRGGLELLHFIASQAVNNPKTGFLNLLQPAQRAIARKSLGASTVRDTAGDYGEIIKGFTGSVLENFGIHLMQASRHAADIGASQGQAIGNLPATVIADMGSLGARGEQLPLPIKAMRTISGLQRKGARIGFGESREFPRLNVLPIAGNVMHGISLTAGIADGVQEARAIELLVKAAMDHFTANPNQLNDPTYRLTHGDIGAQDSTLRMDRGAYDYLRAKMVEYGIGPLENVARDAMERATRGEPILTKDQVLKAAQLAANEVALQGSINTNPAIWDTNKGSRFFTPLLGWPIRQMTQVHEAMRTADGRATFAQFAKTLGILASWALPLGLAFTFVTDEYDEKILKKKTQLGRVSPLALIPGGAPLALATSDIPAKEHLIAMFQRLSKAGNIYGLGFDAASSALAGLDPTSGQRPFSMDSRILAFSQFLNLQQAITNWVNSGFATTYANVERPLLMAMIGSGPLQAVDAIGNALGLDNQEMRMAQRTNVNQWLRAAGREAGIEIRRGGGGSVAPTPMSVWTREMWLAAIGNDRLAFLDAYRRAVDAAREDGATDAEARVLQSWRDRNPLEVFRHRPDDVQMTRMLSAMSDDGRQAVRDALRLYEQYSALIAPSKLEVQQRRMMGQMRRGAMDFQSLRRQMAGGSLSVR